jgi:hypothetical protein
MEGKYSDLTMETITLSEQKTEKVPRISGQDLLELLGLQVENTFYLIPYRVVEIVGFSFYEG